MPLIAVIDSAARPEVFSGVNRKEDSMSGTANRLIAEIGIS